MIRAGTQDSDTGADYALTYGYDDFGRFETVQYAVDGVEGSASYGYLANSGLLESVSMQQDGAATAVTASYGYETHRNVKTLVTNQFGAEVCFGIRLRLRRHRQENQRYKQRDCL